MRRADQYYRAQLDCSGQRTYDFLLSGWQKLKRCVLIPFSYSSSPQMSDTVSAVVWDHPEVFWVDTYNTKMITSVLGMEHVCNYFFSDEEIIHWREVAKRCVEHVISQLPENAKTGDRAWLIYDYLARQVEYRERGEKLSQTIVGPLMSHEHFGVCEGIALAYKFLCDAAKIHCIFVAGRVCFNGVEGDLHAWSIVDLGGCKRHVDVTVAIRLAHVKGVAGNGSEFAKRDTEMNEYIWNRRLVPRCE